MTVTPNGSTNELRWEWDANRLSGHGAPWMRQTAAPRFPFFRWPTAHDVRRLTALMALILAAIGSTQLLPGASAQESGDAKVFASKAQDDGMVIDRSSAVATDQVSLPDRSLAVPAIPTDRNDGVAATSQLSSPSGRPASPSQLTLPGQDAGQLGAKRLGGKDMCEQADTAASAVCARPIEARAGEFAGRRQPQLSAEQRLLAQQAATGAMDDAPDGAARRLGTGRSADFTNDDLALAAAVTSGQTGQERPTEEEASDIPADATNAIDAILGTIVNAPPPR
jgi:hypothetical protein